MSEKEIKEIIDKIKQEEFPYALAIAKAYEKLQQENKHLKEKLDIADTNYDIIYDYFSKVNELLGTELCEEVLSEILKLKSENEELQEKLEENTKVYLHASKYASEMEGKYIESNYILTEFEKWLKKQVIYYKDNYPGEDHGVYKDVYNKLQELKGVINNEC